ncbi:MAG: hypothetical protein JWO69_1834 [Thermoleophilia bacterium]|nr:hypothetical protein [Thermoleophilia bacterium]
MKFLPAMLIGLLLLAASLYALALAPGATSLWAVLGVTGAAVAAALIGLTSIAWRWRAGVGPYVDTRMDAIGGVYDDIAEVFDQGDTAGEAAAS